MRRAAHSPRKSIGRRDINNTGKEIQKHMKIYSKKLLPLKGYQLARRAAPFRISEYLTQFKSSLTICIAPLQFSWPESAATSSENQRKSNTQFIDFIYIILKNALG